MAKRSKKKKRPPDVSHGRTAKSVKGEPKKNPPRKSSGVPWPTIVQALVITAGTLWIYWPALHGDWLWDDDIDITSNPITQSPTGLWSIWFAPGTQPDYYPAKSSVQWIQWRLWGMDTLGYHLTNVVLHILNSLLVWRLLSKFGLRLAWLGGLIFAVHPVQVESVAWITELKNTLSLPPFLLAMSAYINFDEHGKKRDYFLALGLFLVAMLCKTTMVLFPVAILLYAWWKRGRLGLTDLKISTPFFLVSLALGLLTIWSQHRNAMQTAVVLLGGVFSRLACAGLSFSFYFSKCFLPVNLMPIYPQWTVDPLAFWQFLPWPFFGGAIYWLWTKRQGWGRHALFGLGFFVILLAPFLGFTAISYMNFTWVMDHFLYVPIIGLIGLAVAAFGHVNGQLSTSFRPYTLGLVTVLMVFLTFESHNYAKIFINSETLWTYELQHNREPYLAYNNLGLALQHLGRIQEAEEQFEQALRTKADYADAHYNLGFTMQTTGHLKEAMEEYRQALKTCPDFAFAHNNLGAALGQMGRLSEAIEQFKEALKINPTYAAAHNNLGRALQQTGQISAATEQYEQALQINPDFTAARDNLTQLQVLQKTTPAKN